ncbi:hypothetical protein B7494_g1591 [Chlorociboria aeruginascens]|nr:hypothetical protein B7494_g1591 [Chlorociboria aeruginascens]
MTSPMVHQPALPGSYSDRKQFSTLLNEHAELAKNTGKIVYFLTSNMCRVMGPDHLRGILERISMTIGQDVYLHYDLETTLYRVGPIVDNDDIEQIKYSQLICKQVADPDFFCYPVHHHEGVGLSLKYCSATDLLVNATSAQEASGSSYLSTEKSSKVPKPKNMWIIYRQHKHSQVLAENPGMHTSDISKIISRMWRDEPAEVRNHYQKLAEEDKSSHKRKHPDYRCSPRKSSEIKKRKTASLETILEASDNAYAPRQVLSPGQDSPSSPGHLDVQRFLSQFTSGDEALTFLRECMQHMK